MLTTSSLVWRRSGRLIWKMIWHHSHTRWQAYARAVFPGRAFQITILWWMASRKTDTTSFENVWISFSRNGNYPLTSRKHSVRPFASRNRKRDPEKISWKIGAVVPSEIDLVPIARTLVEAQVRELMQHATLYIVLYRGTDHGVHLRRINECFLLLLQSNSKYTFELTNIHRRYKVHFRTINEYILCIE